MKKTLYLWIFVIVIFSSCNKKEQLTGHWVSKEYFQGKPFKTIDFYKEQENDSTIHYIQLNKNSLAYSTSGNLVNGLKPNQFEFGLNEYYFGMIEFKNDSIYLSPADWPHSSDVDSIYAGIFTKVDESETLYNELFIGTDLKINLPECKENNTNWRKFPYATNLNIGFQNDTSDSVYINSDDIYLLSNELPRFIKEHKDMVPESTEIELHLNSDRNVPDSFLNKIIAIIRKADPNVKIYKASFDYKAKKLCYMLIQN